VLRASDVFVPDRLTGTTTRVSDDSGPSGAPSISGDGRMVAFTSARTRRAEVYTDGPLR